MVSVTVVGEIEHGLFCVRSIFHSRRDDIFSAQGHSDKLWVIMPEFGMESLEMDAVFYYNTVTSSVSKARDPKE